MQLASSDRFCPANVRFLGDNVRLFWLLLSRRGVRVLFGKISQVPRAMLGCAGKVVSWSPRVSVVFRGAAPRSLSVSPSV